ncbi:MAG: hypothetical protein KDG55_07565 [Rhodocyclaceae bacterium]|nr:hypothetical protein [Rhodocyclaceae bacterium]
MLIRIKVCGSLLFIALIDFAERSRRDLIFDVHDIDINQQKFAKGARED